VIDQVEQCRFGPVQIIENEDQRAAAGEGLEQNANGSERVLARSNLLFLCETNRGRHRVQHLPSGLVGRKRSTELCIRSDLLEDLDEREVRDSVPVREAPPAEHDRLCLQVEKLVDQPRLADTRRPEHCKEMTRSVACCACVCLDKLLQFAVPPNERGVETPLERRRVGPHREQPVGEEGLGLPFRNDSLDRLELERRLGQLPRRFPDQDLAGLRSLFEARRHVDRVARRERSGLVRDHLAGVDPDPHLQPGSELALQVHIQEREFLAHVVRCARGTQGVVFVHDGDSEDGHDGIADELLHRAAVTFEHPAGDCEVAFHHPSQRLRIEPLAKRSRSRDVAEEDRDDLAELAALLFHERRPAGVAEASFVPVRLSTRRAKRHA
jgi:hypothetical protein